jgi:hypothetical protein
MRSLSCFKYETLKYLPPAMRAVNILGLFLIVPS